MNCPRKLLPFAAFICLFGVLACCCFAQEQMPELSDKAVRAEELVDQEKARIETDQEKLNAEQEQYGRDRQSVDSYNEKVGRWLLNAADSRRRTQEAFLQEKSKFSSQKALNKALSTPGSHLHSLYIRLQKEAQMKAQAGAEMANLKLWLQKELSSIQQNQYNLDQENFSLQHDLSLVKTRANINADEAREEKNALYWQNRYAPQYDAGDANAAFDYGYYNPGWGYWYQVPKPYPIVRSSVGWR